MSFSVALLPSLHSVLQSPYRMLAPDSTAFEPESKAPHTTLVELALPPKPMMPVALP